MEGNFIKIDRGILEWEWYQNINTKVLFLHMLLKANWKENKYEGKIIPRGSFVSSIKKLVEETALTEREVRTGISHLKTTGEVTSKSYPKYTVFTVNNYDLYQLSDNQNDKQATSKRHSNDILTSTIEEKKERKNIIYNNISCAFSDEKCTLDDFFESIWKLYPIKKGKGKISKTKKQVLQRIGYEQIKRCIDRFVDDMESSKRDKQYWMNGSSFFNSGYVDYLDTNYEQGGIADDSYSVKLW